MHNAGGLKLAAKRTAFGDVSNTANVVRPSRDDMAIGAKGEYNGLEKPVSGQEDKRANPLLRPAQRPMSVSSLKGLLNGVTTTTTQVPVKQPLVELPQVSHFTNNVANIRKVTTKKSTIVLKDAPIAGSEQPKPALKPSVSEAPIASAHRELPPSTQVSIPDAILHEQTKSDQQSEITEKESSKPKTAEQPSSLLSSEEPASSRVDGVYIDEKGQIQTYDYIDPLALVEAVPEDKQAVPANDIGSKATKIVADKAPQAQTSRPLLEPARRSTLAPVSEPEEYWDEEGEENYDEEGYVTARSFKSRGDNTTGGATTILFPKINQKVKKELAIAKDLVEGSKTAEELEDEAWDTTMVAEYGDEIFQYMKDLEVPLSSSHSVVTHS